MKLLRYLILLLVVLALTSACSCNKCRKDPVAEPVPVNQAALDTLGTQVNDFNFRLFGMADEEGKNLFFSPYSISTALGMVYGGAKGTTAAEIANAMAFTLPEAEQHDAFRNMQANLNALGKRGKAELSVANAIFDSQVYQHLLQPEFRTLLKDKYASDIYSLNFSDAAKSAKFVNDWVEGKTNKRIKDLINEDHIRNSNDGMVLVNAIYFKGNWLVKFDPKQTSKQDFYHQYPNTSVAKPVQLMTLTGDFPYAKLPGCQVLELPYAEEELAMLIVLPDDIKATGKALNAETFQQWNSALEIREVEIYLPSFKFDLDLDDLTGILKRMGMEDAFSSQRADFTGIRKPGSGADLFIMDVLHKAFIEVKEEGTEAAAATAVVMATKAAPGPAPAIPVFRADHPFLYFIMHKPSNTILFMGKLATPPDM